MPASYIELANLASVSTPLFNPTEPTNTWKLGNAVDFDFPTNVVMPAGGRLLVVGFDPLTDTVALTNFQVLYGVSASTPIYGPWQGNLGNTDQTIELKKPDLWRTNGVPYVMVENYLNQAPWPRNADGGGCSLHGARFQPMRTSRPIGLARCRCRLARLRHQPIEHRSRGEWLPDSVLTARRDQPATYSDRATSLSGILW